MVSRAEFIVVVAMVSIRNQMMILVLRMYPVWFHTWQIGHESD
jgi:hypothetical protein